LDWFVNLKIRSIDMVKRFIATLPLIFISVNMLFATNYYVSTTGSDSNNGSSGFPWATPGLSMNKLSAGDTLNIQPGTYVETANYSITASGTAASPIMINAANAVIDIHATGGQHYNFNGSYVVVDGLKFTMTLSGGMVSGGVLGMNGNSCTFKNLELYNIAAALISGSTGDQLYCITSGGGSSYNTCSNLFIHDIKDGDIMRIWGFTNKITSCIVSNCSNPNYNYSGSSQLHADLDQSFGDNNTPSVGNIFEDNYYVNDSIQLATLSQDSRTNIHDNIWCNNIYVNIATCSFMGQHNTMWYNNLFINAGANPGCALRVDGGADTGAGWDASGSQFINNAFITYGIGFAGGLVSSQFIVANNYYGTVSYGALGAIGTSAVNGGNPQFLGAPDYHILATSVFKGAGANLTGIANAPMFDKDGNPRPSTGNWDIGPYEYNNNAPLTNSLPTVSAISANASDIDQSQTGLQIYGGTVVSFSATATNVLTYQWSYTVNGGSTVAFQNGSGAVPAVNFTFGTNTIGNTYVWTLSVSNTQGSAQSQLTLNVVSTPMASSGLTFAAQSGSITNPFVFGTNGTTVYFYQPIQTIGINGNGVAVYNFIITNAGNYEVQALVNAPNTGANSLYVNIDAVPQDPNMSWDILTTSGFEERLISWRGGGTDTANQFVPWIFPLAIGAHQILFYGREANTQLAGFSILPAPPTPPPPLIITGS
jgi:hypothetical protein